METQSRPKKEKWKRLLVPATKGRSRWLPDTLRAGLPADRRGEPDANYTCCPSIGRDTHIVPSRGAVCAVVAIRDRVFRLELTFSQLWSGPASARATIAASHRPCTRVGPTDPRLGGPLLCTICSTGRNARLPTAARLLILGETVGPNRADRRAALASSPKS